MIQTRTLVLGAYAENCYILWDDDRSDLLVIDPGDGLDAIKSAVAATGKTLTDILITHGHFDHILAVAPLVKETGARVHIHPLDQHMLLSESAAVMDRAASKLPFTPVKADSPYPMDEEFDLTVCGMTFHVLHTPGHSPGGVCLILDDIKTVFTGDTLFAFGYGRYDFEGGDLHDLMRSIKKILSLPKDLTLCAGHDASDALEDVARRWNIR